MVAELARWHGVRTLAQATAKVVPGKPAPAVRLVAEVSLKAKSIHIEISGRTKTANRQNEPRSLQLSHLAMSSDGLLVSAQRIACSAASGARITLPLSRDRHAPL